MGKQTVFINLCLLINTLFIIFSLLLRITTEKKDLNQGLLIYQLFPYYAMQTDEIGQIYGVIAYQF